jgi:hypothetical protein
MFEAYDAEVITSMNMSNSDNYLRSESDDNPVGR